jgi:hypothetical protein
MVRAAHRAAPGSPGALPPTVEALFEPTVGTRH